MQFVLGSVQVMNQALQIESAARSGCGEDETHFRKCLQEIPPASGDLRRSLDQLWFVEGLEES